ncbi:TetR/AcrR family transcriptional regulator [Amycolatopsis sp. EV170708-02-1]|uniref:TetR/AcrR family transcriptional regulator n=1 Tax=Amycolatopsis sp. EV170708-02-1 TaxID=2919322 RepID=UPI001F0C8434|nr:TetR/AcrR family transcriptional regulator [Amycolatopsis sp. EV170708-02-1]UMO99403.1 TetR/AcrR family transcriptional regulator [Amycolatopsis sp. EV170708-02-1]
MPNIGGRPATVAVDDIVRAGRELGMRRLSVKAVAVRLGVTATALYRHVDGRWGLERLVGESILAELRLRDDPRHGLERHLLSFALQLRGFMLEHPGLAGYLQLLFPRGDGGQRLLNTEVDALVRRGYEPGAAIVLSGAVAQMTIAMTVSEENSAAAEEADGDGLDRERQAVRDRLSRDDRLAEPSAALPQVPRPEYVRLLLTASIRGLVGSGPPGRPVAEMVADLATTGEGL